MKRSSANYRKFHMLKLKCVICFVSIKFIESEDESLFLHLLYIFFTSIPIKFFKILIYLCKDVKNVLQFS